jgi:uncharacterized protein (TIGR04222 family)
MTIDSTTLQQRIEDFELDDPSASDPFSRRLARENGWTAETAGRVVREYKRFLVLAVTVDHPVTPSEQVDQAWHLHITYTAEYRRFCREVLGRRLDHTPSAGGPSERARYVRCYERTRASYLARFRELPPVDVWPNAEQRFGADLLARRVNLAEHWVVRKPWFLRAMSRSLASVGPRRFWARAMLAGLGVSSLACAADLGAPGVMNGSEFLRLYLVLWLATLVVAWAIRIRERKWAKSTAQKPELDAYEVAALSGGSDAALDAAVATLLAKGSVAWDHDSRTVKSVRDPDTSASPFEVEVHRAIASEGASTPGELRARSTELTKALTERLEWLGLSRARSSLVPLCFALFAPVVGVARVVSRLGTDKPVGFLVVLAIVGVVVAIVSFRPRPIRTALGEATLAELRKRHEALRSSESSAELAASGMLPLAIGLFGVSALDLAGSSYYAALLERPAASHGGYGGGGGCGGGDSGGGCGGGCGGCGGGGD